MLGENGKKRTIELKQLSAVSPSLAETIRICPLQASLSRISEIRSFILENPKAWLGIAYHEVLEKLWSPLYKDVSDKDLVDHLWGNAINSLQKRASDHPLNKRFSKSEKWPGYNLAYACVQLRAQQELAEQSRQDLVRTSTADSFGKIRESDLSAMDGKIIGKPDVVIGNEIHDYKSGNIYEETQDGALYLKQGYIRQLLIYGYLVHETRGYCPTKGKLLPMLGEPVEINLNPKRCKLEAVEAVNLLDSFNTKLTHVVDVIKLANPSPSACRWCQFKALCPAFWASVNEGWVDKLGSGAICGFLTQEPMQIHSGRAFSLSICVTTGTTATRHVTIAPFDIIVHGVSNLQNGDAVRIVNLYQRHDYQFSPTIATICILDSECPSITTLAQSL